MQQSRYQPYQKQKGFAPNKKPGQPSLRADNRQSKPKKEDCVSVPTISHVSTVDLINNSHLIHMSPTKHALQWVQENLTPLTQRDGDTSVGHPKWAKKTLLVTYE